MKQIMEYKAEINDLLLSRNIDCTSSRVDISLAAGLILDYITDHNKNMVPICLETFFSNPFESEYEFKNTETGLHIIIANDNYKLPDWVTQTKWDKITPMHQAIQSYLREAIGADVIVHVHNANTKSLVVCNIKNECISFNNQLRTVVLFAAFVMKLVNTPKVDYKENPEKNELLVKLIADITMQNLNELLLNKFGLDIEVIEKEKFRKSLTKAFSYSGEQAIQEAQSRIESCDHALEDLVERYKTWAKNRNDAVVRLNALLNYNGDYEKKAEDLFNFINHIDGFNLLKIDENDMQYTVRTPLTFIDVGRYKVNAAPNKRKMCYGKMSKEITEIQMKALLDLIFIEKKLDVMIGNMWEITLGPSAGIKCLAVRKPDVVESAMPNTMCQPHLGGFGCYGNFPDTWLPALKAGDYTTVIQQTLLNNQNLNWDDSSVTNYFIEKLCVIKCIKDKEGNYYNAVEYIKEHIASEDINEND